MVKASIVSQLFRCGSSRHHFLASTVKSFKQPSSQFSCSAFLLENTRWTCKSIVCNHQNYYFSQPVRKFQSSSQEEATVRLVYQSGLPVISVPLPSRHEYCKFTLRPISSTVGDFLSNLKEEDKGVDIAHIYSADGCRIASNTPIEHVLKTKFFLAINDFSYEVDPPVMDSISSESAEALDQARMLISHLYSELHLDQHQLSRERELLERLEALKVEKQPLDRIKSNLAASAARRTRFLMWGGLAGMAGQFGLLARLTWWEYSWDIMEPVTYFITYGTAIIMYGYFLLTQQEYVYPDARDRQYLTFLHRSAGKSQFDIERYNKLCGDIVQAEQDLRRLRDPLQLQLPIEPIRTKEAEESSQQ